MADELARLEVVTVAPNADKVDRQLARIEERTTRVERATARKARADQIAARQMQQSIRIARQYEAALRHLEAVQRGTTASGAAARRAANDNHALAASFGALRAAIVALGLGRLASEFVGMADSAKLISGRLKLVTSSSSELADIQEKLFRIAQKTRTSYEATADLYGRVARNADQLGKSQSELLDFTELVSKAIQTSGATAQEASAGLIQLSQALASGQLRGDEFRSVMENLPAVARALAQGLGVPIGALRDMAAAGELTAEKVIDAILKMRESIDRDFASVPRTVGQAMTYLGNELFRAVSEMDRATDGTSRLSAGIVALADNLGTLAKAASGLLAAGGFLALVRTSTALVGVLGAVAGAVATVAGALVALGAVVVGAIAYLVTFRDEIRLSSDSVATLGDYAEVAFGRIKAAIDQLPESISRRLFSPEAVREDIAAVAEVVLTGLDAMQQGVVAFINALINAFDAVVPIIEAVGGAISGGLAKAFEEALGIARAFKQDLADILSGDDFGFDKFEEATAGSMDRIRAATRAGFEGLADELTDIFNRKPIEEAFGPLDDTIKEFLDDWKRQAELLRETKDLLKIWGVALDGATEARKKNNLATAKGTAVTKEREKAVSKALDQLIQYWDQQEKLARSYADTTEGILDQANALDVETKIKLANAKGTEEARLQVIEWRRELALAAIDTKVLKLEQELLDQTLTGPVREAIQKQIEALRQFREATDRSFDADRVTEFADAGKQGAADFQAAWRNTLNEIDRLFDDVFGGILGKLGKVGQFAGALLKDVIGQALNTGGTSGGSIIGDLIGSVFGGAKAGGASKSGGLGFNPISSITNLFDPGGTFGGIGNIATNYTSGGLSGVLLGTAGTDISGGLGAIVGPGTQGLFGSGGAFSFAAAAPYIAAAFAAFTLLSGIFGRKPSVGPTTVGRVTDLTDPSSAVYSFDNGGNDQTAVEGVVKAITEAIKVQTRRFGGTVRPGSGFDIGYFPSPEDGNSQPAGYNLKAIIGAVLEDKDRFKGLSEQEAISKATYIALKEMVQYQSDTLNAIVETSKSTDLEGLLKDLEFGRSFDNLTTALKDLGVTDLTKSIDANTLAAADLKVALIESGQKRADDFFDNLSEFFDKALELFSGEAFKKTETTTTGPDPNLISQLALGTVETENGAIRGLPNDVSLVYGGGRQGENVTGIDVGGTQYDVRYNKDAGRNGAFEALGADGEVLAQASNTIELINALGAALENLGESAADTTTTVTKTQEYYDQLGRTAASINIAKGRIDQFFGEVTGTLDVQPLGEFDKRLQEGIATIQASAPRLEEFNDQLREAYENFPELTDTLGPLNDALIDVTDTVDTAIDTLRAQVQQDFTADIQRQLNSATGFGVINTIDDLIKTRDQKVSEATAIGLDPTEAGVYDLFDAQVRQALSGASIADLNRILTSGQIVDEGVLQIVREMLTDPALPAFVETIKASIASIDDEIAKRKQSIDTLQKAIDGLQRGRVARVINPDLSIYDPQQQFGAAFEEYSKIAAKAAEGDLEAVSRFDAAADATLKAAQAAYGRSDARYIDVFNQIQADSVRVESLTARQLSVEQSQLEELQAIRETLAAQAGASERNYGAKPVKNRAVAALFPEYTGDFGSGQFDAFLNANVSSNDPRIATLIELNRTLKFALGGVMTPHGPLPLNRYAAGGIAASPQLAMFGEGRMPEAYVPLPDGRTIPVTVSAPAANDNALAEALVGMTERMLERMDRLIGVTGAGNEELVEEQRETRREFKSLKKDLRRTGTDD